MSDAHVQCCDGELRNEKGWKGSWMEGKRKAWFTFYKMKKEKRANENIRKSWVTFHKMKRGRKGGNPLGARL